MSAAQARKRTAAQRGVTSDGSADQDAPPISEEEQDEVIQKLREKAASDKKMWGNILDAVVGVVAAITLIASLSTFTSNAYLASVYLVQSFTLLLSLTPARLSPLNKDIAAFASVNSLGIAASQFLFFILAFITITEDTELRDILLWIVPAIVAVVVEWARGAQGGVDSGIEGLEGLKYTLKGA